MLIKFPSPCGVPYINSFLTKKGACSIVLNSLLQMTSLHHRKGHLRGGFYFSAVFCFFAEISFQKSSKAAISSHRG